MVCFGAALSARKCCENDELIIPRGKCGTLPITTLNCTNGKILLRDVILNGDKVSTQDTPGYVFVEDTSQYCIGKMYSNETIPEKGIIDVALVCFEKISQDSKVNYIETSGILQIVSVVFLTLTFAVYVWLPPLRDLQGMCYICLCVSMALGYLSLGVLQLGSSYTLEFCTMIGFLVYVWMLATFFWMNTICINVYRTIKDANYLKKTERQQCLIYNCYAWGGTFILLIVALITNFVEGDHYKPGIGNNSCWFRGRTETWIFFYGPIAVLISANVVLFILSSLNLWQQTKKYEMNKLNNLKHRFLLSLKLFLVMGISWIFEIASFAHGESHIIWRIMDIFNCLQGVVIFILLVVLRKRAIQAFVEDGCCLCITKPLSEKLNPHDSSDDEHILADETVEVRLN